MKVITLLILLGMTVLISIGGTRDDDKAASQQVPPYHKAAPMGKEAAALDVREFAGDPKMKVLYGQANRVRNVLYQLPCYCKCSRYLHHGSLLACYREKHATTCDICQKESVYAFEQTQAGKPVEQIRQEIMKGAWKDIDVDAHVAAQQKGK